MNTYAAQPHLQLVTEEQSFLGGFSGRLVVGGLIISLAVIFAGVYIYNVAAENVPYTREVSAVGGLSAALTSTSTAPMREVHIANDGLTLVRGARVVSSSQNSIIIAIVWGGAEFRWLVDTDSNTAFLTSAGERAAIIDIQPGDIITVTGMLTAGGAEPAINAQTIRAL